MARSFSLTTDLDYYSAGMTSRNLNGWMLAHSTLSAWKQFYHQPYKNDWKEATQKAIERKNKEEGRNFTTVADYAVFDKNTVKRRNENAQARLKEQRANENNS